MNMAALVLRADLSTFRQPQNIFQFTSLLLELKTLNELKKYQSTKSAYHFPLDDSFPFVLIDKTVREMVGNINAGE